VRPLQLTPSQGVWSSWTFGRSSFLGGVNAVVQIMSLWLGSGGTVHRTKQQSSDNSRYARYAVSDGQGIFAQFPETRSVRTGAIAPRFCSQKIAQRLSDHARSGTHLLAKTFATTTKIANVHVKYLNKLRPPNWWAFSLLYRSIFQHKDSGHSSAHCVPHKSNR